MADDRRRPRPPSGSGRHLHASPRSAPARVGVRQAQGSAKGGTGPSSAATHERGGRPARRSDGHERRRIASAAVGRRRQGRAQDGRRRRGRRRSRGQGRPVADDRRDRSAARAAARRRRAAGRRSGPTASVRTTRTTATSRARRRRDDEASPSVRPGAPRSAPSASAAVHRDEVDPEAGGARRRPSRGAGVARGPADVEQEIARLAGRNADASSSA